MEYAFSFHNALAQTGLHLALERLLSAVAAPPVVLCIGSDLAVGDSLGPIVGTMLRSRKSLFRGYIYGDLNAPVTAKEVRYLEQFVRKTHPRSTVVAVDAAVGEESERGLIKLTEGALRPGAGANKRLPKVGDAAILGIVAARGAPFDPLFSSTRLGMVYAMAETIAGALSDLSLRRREEGAARA